MEQISNQNQGFQKKQNKGGRDQKNIVEIIEGEKITIIIIQITIDSLPNIQHILNNNISILISINKYFIELKCISVQNIEI